MKWCNLITLSIYKGSIMNYSLIYKIADAGTESRFWGSAAQEKAQEIASLIAGRSWCDDDARAESLSDWIAYEYAEFLGLMKQAHGY